MRAWYPSQVLIFALRAIHAHSGISGSRRQLLAPRLCLVALRVAGTDRGQARRKSSRSRRELHLDG